MKKLILVDIPMVLPTWLVRIYPPLWAMYLGAYLSDAPLEVEYFDARAEVDATLQQQGDENMSWYTFGMDTRRLAEFLYNGLPDVIGLHIGVSTELGVARQLLQDLKDIGNQAKIILGGSGVAWVSAKYLDPLFRECEICRQTHIGQPLKITLPTNECNINRRPIRQIGKKYEREYQELNCFHSGKPIVSPACQIITSTGCGGKCSFCTSQNRGLVRRSDDSVKKELLHLRSAGYRCIQIQDDNFLGWTKAQVAEALRILEWVVMLGFEGIEFPNGLTVKSMLRQEFLEWLKRALEEGVKIRLSLPFESVSDEVLKRVRKPHNHTECLRLLDNLLPWMDRGLEAEVFLQLAVASLSQKSIVLESWESMQETAAFARSLKSAGIMIDLFFNSPIPGTPLFPIWRERYPRAHWEQLLLTEPSLFYEPTIRQELKEIVSAINNSPRL